MNQFYRYGDIPHHNGVVRIYGGGMINQAGTQHFAAFLQKISHYPVHLWVAGPGQLAEAVLYQFSRKWIRFNRC